MKKSKRSKVSQPEDGVDLISNMPDAILLLILSRLPSTEEVIRSSILSRRWRNLWTAIPSLDITVRKFKKTKFKEFIYWALANKTVDLDSFRLFCADYYSMSTVWRWIHIAVMRNVKQLDLSFYPKDKTKAIELSHCLVTCCSLEVLRFVGSCISNCRLSLPKFKGFPALRVLDLADVDLLDDRDLVKDFLESCPSLEDLALFDCVLCKLDLLCISCPKLKRLSIIICKDGCGCDIKISCPKLVDLDLRGLISFNVFFERLDSLKKAVVGNNISVVLFPGISGVEYLCVNLYFFSQCIDAARDPSLPNLKNLKLTTTMDVFTMDKFNRVLKYYPKLESLKLFIKQDFNEEYGWLDKAKTRKILTRDVKRVEYFELNGEKPKVDIAWTEDILNMFFSWGDIGDRFPLLKN